MLAMYVPLKKADVIFGTHGFISSLVYSLHSVQGLSAHVVTARYIKHSQSHCLFVNFRSRDAVCTEVDVSGTTRVRTRRVRTDTKQKLRWNPVIKLSKTCSTGIHKSCIPVIQVLDCLDFFSRAQFFPKLLKTQSSFLFSELKPTPTKCFI